MIHHMKIGDYRSYQRTITKEEVRLFGELTGDLNDVHFNEDYAKTTPFKKTIVHGMLVGSLFSKIFGLDYPGEGTIYIAQSLIFKKPVYPDDLLNVVVTVKDIILERNRVIFSTEIFNEQNELMLTGEATVMPRKLLKEI